MHAATEFSPCPIETPIGWVGTTENLWLVEGLQASLFPTKKEGKKVDNGMMLRKRKAQAIVDPSIAAVPAATVETEDRPRKRTRTSRVIEKENVQTQPLSQSDAVPDTTATSEEKPTSKASKLELVGVELPPMSSIEVVPLHVSQPARATLAVPSPEPTRRSTRQANKRPATGRAASVASTPMTELASLPETLSPISSSPAEVAEEAPRPPLTRARSSSSSSGSSTAVSDTGSAGDTTVEPDSAEGDGKDKGMAKTKDTESEEKTAVVRTSGRVRKPAKKALHVEDDVASPKKANAAVTAPVSEGRKTRARRA
jgi:hypothetical protein